MSSHAQIRPQGAEKQLRKVVVGGGGCLSKDQNSSCSEADLRFAELVNMLHVEGDLVIDINKTVSSIALLYSQHPTTGS